LRNSGALGPNGARSSSSSRRTRTRGQKDVISSLSIFEVEHPLNVGIPALIYLPLGVGKLLGGVAALRKQTPLWRFNLDQNILFVRQLDDEIRDVLSAEFVLRFDTDGRRRKQNGVLR